MVIEVFKDKKTGKLALPAVILAPSTNWNRDFTCDVCGWHAFVAKGEPFTKPFVFCLMTRRMECENCHAHCIEKYQPNVELVWKNNGHSKGDLKSQYLGH